MVANKTKETRETRARLKQALSLPEPAQTLALREVFDEVNGPAIEAKIRSALTPILLANHAARLVEQHRAELEKIVADEIAPLVVNEVNRIFMDWQRHARRTGDLLHVHETRVRKEPGLKYLAENANNANNAITPTR